LFNTKICVKLGWFWSAQKEWRPPREGDLQFGADGAGGRRDGDQAGQEATDH